MLTKLYKLEHCTYCCQYHVVWTPRYRGKVMADTYIKLELKRIFKFIAKWKGIKILEWHIGDEHIHLYLVIPPKKFPKGSLWARGYFVSTIGINEFAIRKYIQNQSNRQVDMENLKLF